MRKVSFGLKLSRQMYNRARGVGTAHARVSVCWFIRGRTKKMMIRVRPTRCNVSKPANQKYECCVQRPVFKSRDVGASRVCSGTIESMA
jgi:hypothetical protein